MEYHNIAGVSGRFVKLPASAKRNRADLEAHLGCKRVPPAKLTRETRMFLYCVAASAGHTQATPLVRRQDLISKRPFRSAAKALQ